ncbi:MAG: hypothetical protein M1831_006676 [Alyxoria varia]|nr:MAG: hypothetical protein M1831_006676 [Alyxoria varia]
MAMAGPSSAYSDLDLYICALDNEFGFRLAGNAMRWTPTHSFNKSDEGRCCRHLRFLWYKDIRYASHYLDDAVRWLRESIPWDSRVKSLASFKRILANQENKAIHESNSNSPNKRTLSRSANNSFQDLDGSNVILPEDRSRDISFTTDTSANSFNDSSTKVFSFGAGASDTTQNTSFSTVNGNSLSRPDLNLNVADESLKHIQRNNEAPSVADPFWQPAVSFLSPHKSFREPVTTDLDGEDTEPATPVDSLHSTPQKRKIVDDISPSARKTRVVGHDVAPPPPPLDFRFRMLRHQGLFVSELPSAWNDAPWRVRYEYIRLGQLYGVDWQDFPLEPCAKFKQHSALVDAIKTQAAANVDLWQEQTVEFPSPSAWEAAASNNPNEVPPNLMLAGKLKYAESRSYKSILNLSLSPLRLDLKAHRFAHKYGAHRFLRLSIPSFRTRPGRVNERELRDALAEWLSEPNKRLIGCLWTVLYLKPGDTKKKGKHRSDVSEFEAFLFATEGPGLESISIEQAVGWYMPLALNGSYAAMKMYSRLELGFSRTLRSVTFKPSQVFEVPDRLADGAEEDVSLQDPAFDWNYQFDTNTVMNDGCSRVSAAAARLAWEKMGKFGPLPSAFQGRIGCAKGMWIVQRETPDTEGAIWIELSKSQRKFYRHEEDFDDSACYDPVRLTLNISCWPEKPVPSTLYREFLPILEDRGVPRATLIDYVAETMQSYTSQWLEAVDSGVALRRWLQETETFTTDQEGVEVAQWDGSRRKSKNLADKAKSLLEAGFEPRSFRYLAELTSKIVSWKLAFISNELKIQISKSTFLFGVADPTGCLGPNEIHLDPEITEGAQFVGSVDALVARHPALRRSDIQRVKIVFKPELMHLRHIAVFPVTGTFPLAGKLQGGDYDGDCFWICWEPKLVLPFRNAPAPTRTPQPESLGIKVNRTTCRDSWTSDPTLRTFLSQAFEFQMQPQQLGKCTNFLEKFRYSTGQLQGSDFEKLADIHDLIIDAPKNGYTLTDQAWSELISSLDVPLRQLVDPAYKNLASQGLFSSANESTKRDDIIDYLVFHVAREKSRGFVKDLEESLHQIASTWEESLVRPLKLVQEQYRGDPEICAVLNRLMPNDVSPIIRPWLDAGIMSSRALSQGQNDVEAVWAAARDQCSELFKALKPRLEDDGVLDPTDSRYKIRADPCSNPTVKAWLLNVTDHGMSHWDAIKTAALYKHFHPRPDFIFHIAGYNLCRIKAESLTTSVNRPEICTTAIFSHLKMRKRKFDEINADARHFVEDECTLTGANDSISEEEDEFHDANESVNGISQSFADSSLDETANVLFAPYLST